MKKSLLLFAPFALFLSSMVNAESLSCKTDNGQQYKINYSENSYKAELIIINKEDGKDVETVISKRAHVQRDDTKYSLNVIDHRKFYEMPGDGQGPQKCFKFGNANYSISGKMIAKGKYEGQLNKSQNLVFKPGYGYGPNKRHCPTPMFSFMPPQEITCNDSAQKELSQDTMILAAARQEVQNLLSRSFWAGGPPRIANMSIDRSSQTIPLNHRYPFMINVKVKMTHVTWASQSKIWVVQVQHKNGQVIKSQIISFN
ncbi:MAG: hypothetical protein HOO06_06955 [Bdellovibrionaceae bacterium]|jgi:hypothetical protein|nr:hypothetical protein [Pseudobdellovibrionaceae bacterium]